MSDRTYSRFSIPMSILADPAKADAVRCAFDLTVTEFQRIILAEPEPDEAAGFDCISVRLVDDRPCLVHEDANSNYGGTHLESVLTEAGIPFIQANGAGDEYGPAATARVRGEAETIRVDHLLAPIVGVGLVDGRIVLDQQEIRDVERYLAIRRMVLHYPAAV